MPMVYLRLLGPLGIDFPQFYEAAWLMLNGGNPYHSLITSPGPFNYPPGWFTFFFWLGLFPLRTAAVIFNLTSLASVILAIQLLGKMAFKTWNANRLIFTGCVFGLTFFPLKYNLDSGQINGFVLLAVTLSLWWYRKGHAWFSASALAAAIGVKLVPVIFLLIFIAKRDWIQTFRIIWATLLLSLIPFIFIPLGIFQPYFQSIFMAPFTLQGKAVYYNQSFIGFLTRTFPSAQVQWLFPLLVIIILILSWYQLKTASILTAYALTTCIALILHPLTWQHHLVLALIPLIIAAPYISIRKAAIIYLLLAINLRTPSSLPAWLNLIKSHQFYGVFVLWLTISYAPLRHKPA